MGALTFKWAIRTFDLADIVHLNLVALRIPHSKMPRK